MVTFIGIRAVYLARECCREFELSRPSRKLEVAAKKRPKLLRAPALKLNRSRARPPIQDLSRLRVEAVEIVLGVLGPFAFELAKPRQHSGGRSPSNLALGVEVPHSITGFLE